MIRNSLKIDNLTHAAGIQSPGVASSPAIARTVSNLVVERRGYAPNGKFDPIRRRKVPFRETDLDEIGGENVVCRCETVTGREIEGAVHGIVPAHTVDAVKRRTRAGMGRCQGGFCGPRVIEILARELGIDPVEVTLKGPGTNLLISKTRG